jgi:hypothetical protein
MTLRDAALITCFTLSANLRRPVGRAMFYIALADFLLPIVFIGTQHPEMARIAMPLFRLALPGPGPVLLMSVHAVIALVALGVRVGKDTPRPDR